MNNGRDKLPWSPEVWSRIDQAVREECERTKVAAKFLPVYRPASPGEMTSPSEIIQTDEQTFFIDEADIVPLIELWVEFSLTPQQVEREAELVTAVTLAKRAANLVAQAEDGLIFGGREAIEQHPIFSNSEVQVRAGPAETWLLNAPELNPDESGRQFQIVRVPALDPNASLPRYGENTFAAVEEAYRNFHHGRGRGLTQDHYGPYALVLHTDPYTDTFAALPVTLLMPGERIQKLVQWSYGTNTLPPFRGLLISLASSAVDLVVGMETTASFLQEDPRGQYRFRVSERFALRLKDPTAVIRLEFDASESTESDRSEHYAE